MALLGEKYWIGIDLGGTNVRMGLFNDLGVIVDEKRWLTEADKGPDYVIQKLIDAISSIKKDYLIQAIGIGLPGSLNSQEGIVLSCTNLPKWINIPLARIISDSLQTPCFIENDCNVAALAEATMGAGKGYDIVYYITVSTGVGGGLCINGEIISGATGNAGEIANIIVGESKIRHSYLNSGSLESMASGLAILRAAKEKGLNVKYAHEVFILASQGDKDALDVTESALDFLARGMAAIAHVVDPHIFILGGGVAVSVPGFTSNIREKYEKYVYEMMRGKVKIELAKLKEPGIIGAMHMAKKQQEAKAKKKKE